MEPNTLIYALNEFIVIYRKILLIIFTNFIIIIPIINFQGLFARQPYLCNNTYLVCYLDIATWIYMVARYIC